jgi:hypothetical protein
MLARWERERAVRVAVGVRSVGEARLDAPAGRHHDASMRTTLTLDDDVARLIEVEAHRQKKPIKQVVNEALRRGLSTPAPAPRRRRFQVQPHKTTLRPGVDIDALNALADELEDEASLATLRANR